MSAAHSPQHAALQQFADYAAHLKGDEKGEAQVFLDRFFQAFGHGGYQEAGATLEARVKRGKGTGFADLLWPGRVLVEMKKRGEDLRRHFDQARDYWMNLFPKPRLRHPLQLRRGLDLRLQRPASTPSTASAWPTCRERASAFGFLRSPKTPPLRQQPRRSDPQGGRRIVARVFSAWSSSGGSPAPRRPALHPPVSRLHVRRGHRAAARKTSSPSSSSNAPKRPAASYDLSAASSAR